MASVVILGGGPAGLSAAVYASRAGQKPIVLYKDGGALERTDKIENYFGFPEPLSGAELLARGRAQAERLGAALVQAEVTGLEYAPAGFSVKTTAGTYTADAVILATGAARTAPAVAGAAEFEGRGVSYCAVCDAFFYRGKAVAVLGQGSYALEEAGVLLPVAASVTLLTNGAQPPAPLPNGLSADTRPIAALEGGETLSRVVFTDGAALPVDGVFVAIGTAGSTDLARKLGAAVKNGHICTDQDMAANVPGLFAAGDCTGGLLQIAKAVADGAQAALSAVKFLRG